LPVRGDWEPEAAVVTVGAPLEKAGEDMSLLIAFDPHHKLVRALNEAHMKGTEVARANATVLMRFDEFVGADDPRLIPMARAGLDGLRVVGCYARV
jgi:chorismate mutase / prephenate dehydratase